MNEARRTMPVKIKLDHLGCGSIEIGGQKLAQYTASIQIVSVAGDVPKVLIEVIPLEGLQVELDGLVDVVVRQQAEATPNEVVT